MNTLNIDELKTLNPWQLENRLSYKGKDKIIMAALAVLKEHVADGGYKHELVRSTYGTFVLDASAALDRGDFCGYVSWPLADGKDLSCNWALKADCSAIIVGRADTDKRVKLPANRVFKK